MKVSNLWLSVLLYWFYERYLWLFFASLLNLNNVFFMEKSWISKLNLLRITMQYVENTKFYTLYIKYTRVIRLSRKKFSFFFHSFNVSSSAKNKAKENLVGILLSRSQNFISNIVHERSIVTTIIVSIFIYFFEHLSDIQTDTIRSVKKTTSKLFHIKNST